MKYDEILGYINEFNIGNMLPQVELHKSIDDDSEIDIDYDVLEEKSKIRKNDKGKAVPDKCPKCGAKVGVFIKGEPVYLCSNKKCKKYFGTVPCNFNESVFDNLLFLIENSTPENGEEFNVKRTNVAKKMQDNLYLYLKKYVQNKELKEKYKDYLYLIKIEKLPCTSYDAIVQITELQDGIDTEKYDEWEKEHEEELKDIDEDKAYRLNPWSKNKWYHELLDTGIQYLETEYKDDIEKYDFDINSGDGDEGQIVIDLKK